jgi:hypothetical protein
MLLFQKGGGDIQRLCLHESFLEVMRANLHGCLNGDGLHRWYEDHFGWLFEWRWSSWWNEDQLAWFRNGVVLPQWHEGQLAWFYERSCSSVRFDQPWTNVYRS